MKLSSPYNGALTREQLLFHEIRTMAKLVATGLTDGEIAEAIIKDNPFQYPTEKSIKNLVGVCLKRLHSMNDDCLMEVITKLPVDVAKQTRPYAMMEKNRLAWGFVITVIGEEYRILDTLFGKVDLNTFFMCLTEQDDNVASWSDTTVQKIKQVLVCILMENEYLNSTRVDHLNPVLIGSPLEERIRANNNNAAPIASDCLSQEDKECGQFEWASR